MAEPYRKQLQTNTENNDRTIQTTMADTYRHKYRQIRKQMAANIQNTMADKYRTHTDKCINKWQTNSRDR